MGEKIISIILQNKLVFFLVFVAAVLRFSYLSPWLEDWDSIQLALGLHHYSIVNHQPHPPGYPLYIILGRLFYIFTQNDTSALTSLSAVLGSLSVLPLYLLVTKMFDRKTAILSSLIFIIMPIHWFFSEIALTDVPGLFFLLLFGYFIYLSRDNPKKIFLSSLFAGLILGVRFNEVPVAIGLMTLVVLVYGNLKLYVFSLTAFILGISIWLIPLVFVTGPHEFIASFTSITDYVVKHDVLLGGSFSFKVLLKTKLEQLFYLFDLSYTKAFIVLSLLSLTWVILKPKLRQDFKIQFLFTWIISYSIPLLLVYNLEIHRHVLPLLPPLIILVTVMCTKSIRNQAILILTFLLLGGGIFPQSLQRVSHLNSEVPPTIQPINYVKQNFNPGNTIIIASYIYRQFQYYAPEFQVYYSDQISAISVEPHQKVIIDYQGLKDKIIAQNKFKITEIKEFAGDKEIFPKISQTTLYILEYEE